MDHIRKMIQKLKKYSGVANIIYDEPNLRFQ